ncbi:MAG: hypothetical protein U0790_27400 [Isosphaeraceae bacterium]
MRLPLPAILVREGLSAARLLVRVGILLAGTFVLFWVANRSGPDESELVVHVSEPDVELSIGEETYTIKGRALQPIVRILPPGSYSVVVRRGPRELFRQAFDLRPGGHVVCTAWDQGSAPEKSPLPRDDVPPHLAGLPRHPMPFLVRLRARAEGTRTTRPSTGPSPGGVTP